MVGYNGSMGYRLWNAATRKIFDLRDIVFDEGIGHWSRSPAGGDVELARDEQLHIPVDLNLPLADNSAPLPADTVEPSAAALPNPPVDIPGTPTNPAPPRRSTRPHALSKAIQAARDTVLDEAATKAASLDWATGHKKPNMTAHA
jgi:hypothetical protein